MEFEGFRLDAEHLLLYRDGVQLPLTPKQVETLLALIEHSGEVVSKEELMARLWGDTAVEETNLVQNIYVLRKALGDSRTDGPLIETLRRRGYRFTGRVESSGKPDIRNLENRRASAVPRRWMIASVIIVAVVVSAFVLYTRIIQPTIKKRSIAVLPFSPIDDANQNDLYELGIADALINRLSSVEGLSVRPLSATRSYKRLDQDPVAAGIEQKVDYVLSGNYQIDGGKIRVTAQLVNVHAGQLEEPFKYEREIGSIFAIQDAVADDVSARLALRFQISRGKVTSARGTSNQEAYRHYLRGMYVYNRHDPGYVERSLEILGRAIELDPSFARAWAGKALAYRARAYSYQADPKSDYINTMEAIERALALDPDQSDAHSALCDAKFTYEYDFQGAETECLKAIELDPNSSVAHEEYAVLLSSRGRHDESVKEVKLAVDLDPTSYQHQRSLGNSLYLARRYSEAKSQYLKVLEMNEGSAPAYQWLIRTHEAEGDVVGAFDWFRKSLVLARTDSAVISNYETIFANEGWKGVLRERIRRAATDGGNLFRLAGWAAQTGEYDRAFELLEKALEQRLSILVHFEVEPQFDPIRSDPRYPAFVARIKQK